MLLDAWLCEHLQGGLWFEAAKHVDVQACAMHKVQMCLKWGGACDGLGTYPYDLQLPSMPNEAERKEAKPGKNHFDLANHLVGCIARWCQVSDVRSHLLSMQ